MTTLISGEQTWLMWAVLIAMAAFAIWAEQRTKIGSKIAAGTIAIFGTMLLANIHLIPTSSPVYSAIGSYVLPLSIPLLLFKCNMKRLLKDSGHILIVFLVAAVGTIIGSLTGGLCFKNSPDIVGLVAMSVGGGIGGSVNIMAMANLFQVDPATLGAYAVVGNFLVTVMMITLMALCGTKFVRSRFNHPHINAVESGAIEGTSLAEQYWKPKNISLLSIALTLAVAFGICAVSYLFTTWIGQFELPLILAQFLGSIFLVMTTITLILVTLFPKFFERLEGAEEIGVFMMMLYLCTIGGGASFTQMLTVGKAVVITVFLLIVCNVGLGWILGRIFKWNWEEIVLSSCASVGGPTTAIAVAINKGWKDLIVPGLLAGLLGNAIGNYFGMLVGDLMQVIAG